MIYPTVPSLRARETQCPVMGLGKAAACPSFLAVAVEMMAALSITDVTLFPVLVSSGLIMEGRGKTGSGEAVWK